MMMLIFTLIFGRFARIPSEGFPYPVFVFAGLIPWTLFSQGMSASALSLVNQQHLLTKVYFPRLFVPIAAAAVFLVDLLISLVIYAVILLYYGVAPSWGIVWLPPLILLTLVATLGLGVTLAALTVFYRDFKHIVPFLVQILMYVTPVIYPSGMIGPALAVGPVAQPDVRDHRRVPLGDPRPALELRVAGDLHGVGRGAVHRSPSSTSAGPSGGSPTSPERPRAGRRDADGRHRGHSPGHRGHDRPP